MNNSDIVNLRLRNQGLSKIIFTRPEEIVATLGAVQSQDYAGAKWALGQRIKNAKDAQIDQAFNEGKILRTHVMRPTWHFVTPADIHWILALTAPRVRAASAHMYRQLELDRSVIRKSYAILEKALQGNAHLTRAELASTFDRAGLLVNALRMTYFMMSAELDGLICSGPRRGRQFTYALLEERAPKVRAWDGEESLAELVRRYFSTRGPATLQDFTWWSGLTMADAKHGIEMVKSQFVSTTINGQTYWWAERRLPAKKKSPTVHLLPNYDEFFIGLRDRSAIGQLAQEAGRRADDPAFIANIVILDGQVVGGWKRKINKDAILLELNLITPLTKGAHQAIAGTARQYSAFLGLPVEVT